MANDRFTQVVVEVVIHPVPALRSTQDVVEVVIAPNKKADGSTFKPSATAV